MLQELKSNLLSLQVKDQPLFEQFMQDCLELSADTIVPRFNAFLQEHQIKSVSSSLCLAYLADYFSYPDIFLQG